MKEIELNNCIEKIVERIKSKNDFLIIGHNDSDGITSTAIIFKAIERENKKVDALNLKQLYKSDVELIQEKGLNKQIIFVDLGSGQKEALAEIKSDLIIIDHHQPQGNVNDPWIELNPGYFEIDGAKDISSSGLIYLVAKKYPLLLL